MSFLKKTTILVFVALNILLFHSGGVHASVPDEKSRIIGNIFSYGPVDRSVILIEKKTDRLFLVKLGDPFPEVLAEYSVVTGQNNGDKLREGDQKTPEGIYHIVKYIPPEKLDTRLFGNGAFPINYPNIVDRIHGKTGHGIWIHGRGELTNGRRTNGCISLTNDNLANLKGLLEPGFPVVITEEMDFLSPARYREERQTYLNYLMGLINAWKENNFSLYKSFFSRSFRSSWNEDYTSYLERKKRLMLENPEKFISLKEIVLYKENSKELMYEYKQLYCTDNYIDFGLKKLYFEANDNGEYMVIAEDYKPLPVEPEIKDSVVSFIKKWLDVWKKEDIKRYISFYSDRFSHGKMDLEGWSRYKKGVFERSNIKRILIGDIRIKLLYGGRIQVRFIQDYESDILKDRGIKTLVLQGCPGNFRIVQEYWKPL